MTPIDEKIIREGDIVLVETTNADLLLCVVENGHFLLLRHDDEWSTRFEDQEDIGDPKGMGETWHRLDEGDEHYDEAVRRVMIRALKGES